MLGAVIVVVSQRHMLNYYQADERSAFVNSMFPCSLKSKLKPLKPQIKGRSSPLNSGHFIQTSLLQKKMSKKELPWNGETVWLRGVTTSTSFPAWEGKRAR